MDFFLNCNVSTGDVDTTRVAGHQDNVFDVPPRRHNARRQRVVSHPEAPVPSRLHRDNSGTRAVTSALGADRRHALSVQEHVYDGQPVHHNARRERVRSHPDPPAPSRRHRNNNANLDVVNPSEAAARHVTGEHENRQPRPQQNPRRRRSLSHSDVPVAPRRHHDTDINRPASSVILFDARGNQYNEVGGRVYDYFHDPPHQRELPRRDATSLTYNGNNATTARDATFGREQSTRPTLLNHQRHSQSIVPTIRIETSSGSATLDSYTATHDPPPYPRPFPRSSSTPTLSSSSGTLSSSNMTHRSDKKSQPSSSVMQPWMPDTRPEIPPAFASRYIVFQLDKETTTEKLREIGDDVLIPSVKNMSDNKYVGYISEGHMDDDPQVYRVFLLRHDLPEALVERGLTPDMSIAVEPSNQWPYGREPLHVEKPLPSRWGDCYHYAHDHLLVRIPHIPSSNGYYAISHHETRRHLDTIRKDLMRRVVKQNNYWVERLASSPDETTTFAPRKDSDVSLMEMQSETIMTIRISHDIERIAKVPDPYEFMQQQWYLSQMKKNLMMNRKAELESATF